MKIFILILLFSSTLFSQVIRRQVSLESPNAKCYLWNTGVFDQNMNINNSPGFEWPKNSGKFANFTCGLSIGCIVNGTLRMGNASYSGEYAPGYIIDSLGIPIPKTDSTFRHYKVIKGDTPLSNYDYLNWGRMVPYGAPYIDANNNGIYEPYIDTPGVKNALQTVFICITDGFPGNHTTSEGLPGGTKPLNAEIHITAWTYPYSQTQDAQFLKWEILNKNDSNWTKCYFSYYTDVDLGDTQDDYFGCDTLLKLGYGYNADNMDGTGTGNSYGANPPAFGLMTLKAPQSQSSTDLPFIYNVFFKYPAPCDYEYGNAANSYNSIKGFKRDGSNNLDPTYFPPKPTRVCFAGNPETGEGWTCYSGRIYNCGGLDTGAINPISSGRSFYQSYGDDNYTFEKNTKNEIILAQLIARGTNNRNSVTKLKQFSSYVKQFYDNNYTIGINQIQTKVPENFFLYQNYPNPFNPSTKIVFDIPESKFVNLSLYDINGRLIKTLFSGNFKPGKYSYDFFEPSLTSGIYYYSLSSENFSSTKKMVLIK